MEIPTCARGVWLILIEFVKKHPNVILTEYYIDLSLGRPYYLLHVNELLSSQNRGISLFYGLESQHMLETSA